MASPKGFILYRIWYGEHLAYLGRTKQPLQARIRGHMFAKPMHRAIDIHNVTKIEYTEFPTEADMNLYEIYFINLWKPPLNVDDKARDDLTISLPDKEWTVFVPSKWEEWKNQLKLGDMCGWHKVRNEKIFEDAQAIRMVRTEEGKALRKEYESGAIHHGFNEHREMELRTDGVSNTLSTVQKDNYICEKSIVAMRGRNPDNPSDRTVGSPTEQRLEPNSQGLCNTLTSVQKDNLVMETVRIKQATSKGYIECEVCGVADLSFPDSKTRRGRVQEKGQVSPTLMAGEQDVCRIEHLIIGGEQKHQAVKKDGICTCLTSSMGMGGGYVPMIAPQYRIRKLTPRECWRLMDFTDEDFHKAEEVNSNTQLYKQAGNSIVRNVLVAILGQMIPGKEDVYRK